MGRVAIVAPEDGGAITASSSGSGTSPSALLRVQPTDVWQAAAAGEARVQYDRGAAAGALDTVALLFASPTPGDTWRVRAATTAAALTGAPQYDSGVMTLAGVVGSSPRRHLYHRLPAPQSLRFVRIDVTTASAPATAGRLIIGLAWEPLHGYGTTRGYEGGIEETVTVGGQIVLDRQEARPTLAIELFAEDRAEFDRHALALQQFNREVLVALDANAPAYLQQRLYYGVMQGRGVVDETARWYRHRIELRGLL